MFTPSEIVKLPSYIVNLLTNALSVLSKLSERHLTHFGGVLDLFPKMKLCIVTSIDGGREFLLGIYLSIDDLT